MHDGDGNYGETTVMTGVVVCGGIITDHDAMRHWLAEADITICADSGAAHFEQWGITPDILIGDMDSISKDHLERLQIKGVKTIRHPVEKNMTDSELALEIAAEKGCTTVIMLGATGARLDHTLANIFLLKKLFDKGITGIIADEKNEITLIDDRITMKKDKAGETKVSLVPLTSTVTGVTTQGLYYPLENASMELGTTWGISNEFVSSSAQVSIGEGLMLVIRSKD